MPSEWVYHPNRIRQPGSLKQTIGFGTPVDGSRAAKQDCLTLAHENLEQAKVILEHGPHPTSAVLQLELALMQIGNSVALIFDRSIEASPIRRASTTRPPWRSSPSAATNIRSC